MNLLRSQVEVDVTSEFFGGHELACHCCGECFVDFEALQCLDALRRALGRALVVVSGYRCLKHNTAVGGAPASYHMRGKAFDVAVTRGKIGAFVTAAKEAGFRGIIMYPRKGFVHIDTRDTPLLKVSS